ncbi:EF-hand domain-containing protein [Pontiella sulfatireligans]|uniref:EF-hand domain-containing protein n=1 Tax=Pontiella sulfatireligans TaxID=2750658 RepID=A0A6C2UKA6_9BACT|nr:hypothetical protein [Pontiella sulfatireligans]VGO20313.1 hypothetical protein SCARR_02375 [Pontiella sulfatireligans]
MMKRLGLLLLLAASMGCKGPGGPPGGGGGRGKASGADFVKRLDKNGDGKVSQKEFDGPSKHFTESDKDGDGFISEEEAPTGPPLGGGRR